jgi:hypothetical protein
MSLSHYSPLLHSWSDILKKPLSCGALAQLYPSSKQCCYRPDQKHPCLGQRFATGRDYEAHVTAHEDQKRQARYLSPDTVKARLAEAHSTTTSQSTTSASKPCRGWLASSDDLLKEAPPPTSTVQNQGTEHKKVNRVKAPDNTHEAVKCAVCQDIFKVVLDQEEEEWFVENAVMSGNCIVHVNCA